MDDKIICIGCGAILQSTCPEEAGYIPASRLKNVQDGEDNDVYCQRCFRLRHYNEIMPVDTNNDDFLALLNSMAEKKALIVNVVDLFDFTNSLLSSITRFIGNNDFILVGNKFDLFPQNLRQSKIKDWMRQEANRVGLFPKKIFLVSAKKQKNLEKLISYLDIESRSQDVYFVGMTNVGKSTLLNAIIDQMGDIQDLITTSRFPGTTLDKIEIPLENGHLLVDTPGIMTENQLATHLSAKELAIISPQKPLKPATYQLKPGNTLFLAGLGRIDFLKGEPASFTVYAARELYIHRTKTEKADEFYSKHVGELLSPPSNEDKLPELKGKKFHTSSKSDLLFGGIGFVTVPNDCLVKVYTPSQIGLGIRRALI
ncbi:MULTISPECIES: ribosome biogenesis GTPase YqeH [unclassified Lactobacillus]|uniref:ribosome biogenesis GTPase YqeH n=1 Tax=unclassified Lactobacillus TaxID=2620435 RepID=UPI000EFC5A10|nr:MULTISPECIES: ribosome biogenesis GTPase YqeH [unclassified Lactobacillus]RMC24192.1 ribosome biogenesis GTPase YqeH [Lactobacillus sp. ESL0247]RMC28765.1 ribosome biogenesis GTPase YqeH [Lactobacillus sp. ESL0246]RMC31422.1 ribosome biogenesis GTPase YqeH [Lactobacillus sp. ESL0245]